MGVVLSAFLTFTRRMSRVVIVFFMGCAMWAQEGRGNGPRPVVKLMPLALVDPLQYTLHGGLEFPISRTGSIQAEGGWVFGYLGETSETDFTQKGFKLRLSLREYYAPKSPRRELFILEGGYIAVMGGYQQYNQTIQVDTTGKQGYYYPEYERTIQGVEGSFLLGYHVQVGQRLSLDVWGGVGIRYGMHRWSPRKPPPSGIFSAELTPVGDFILRPGGRPIPRLGIAIGWILQ